MRRTIVLSGIIILLTAFSLGYFIWLRPQGIEQKAETKTQNTLKTEINRIVAPGVVEPVSEEIEVGAEIPGKLKTVFVEEGDSVSKGQVIAMLENQDFEAQLSAAKAQIETLRRQQETAKAKLGSSGSRKNARRKRRSLGRTPRSPNCLRANFTDAGECENRAGAKRASFRVGRYFAAAARP
jgi:multidrug efflux pump subunit AcrA (membrane-fusion protein)